MGASQRGPGSGAASLCPPMRSLCPPWDPCAPHEVPMPHGVPMLQGRPCSVRPHAQGVPVFPCWGVFSFLGDLCQGEVPVSMPRGVPVPRLSLCSRGALCIGVSCPRGPRCPHNHGHRSGVSLHKGVPVPRAILKRPHAHVGVCASCPHPHGVSPYPPPTSPSHPPHHIFSPSQQRQGPGVQRLAGHRLPKRGRCHQLRRAADGRVLHPPRGQVRGAWVLRGGAWGRPFGGAWAGAPLLHPSVPAGRPARTTPARRSPSCCPRSGTGWHRSRTGSQEVGGGLCHRGVGGTGCQGTSWGCPRGRRGHGSVPRERPRVCPQRTAGPCCSPTSSAWRRSRACGTAAG